jgi:hypothetical protein
LEEEKMISIFQSEKETIAAKLIQYLSYSGLEANITFNKETEVYEVFVPVAKQNQAQKLYEAFHQVEIEKQEEKVIAMEQKMPSDHADPTKSNEEGFDSKEGNDDGYSTDTTYVMKEDQYKDLNSTVWIFLLFGIAGMVVVLFNIAGIFSFINNVVSIFALTALFLFFIYVGLSTNTKAKKIKSEIEEENKLTEKINKWLEANISESFLASIHNNAISDELNYIKKTNIIKDMLIKEFGSQNGAYLDRLIEEYYNKTFEENPAE